MQLWLFTHEFSLNIDFADEGRKLARELRADGADVVIALTHMRWPNDRRLAQEVDEIDIVLGMKLSIYDS